MGKSYSDARKNQTTSLVLCDGPQSKLRNSCQWLYQYFSLGAVSIVLLVVTREGLCVGCASVAVPSVTFTSFFCLS